MPNDASAALHRKLGFGLLGTYHNTGYKNGRWRDVVWFEKHIGSFDGVPEPIRYKDRVVGVVMYRDNTIIDVIRQIDEDA